jgi:hypothetical protein
MSVPPQNHQHNVRPKIMPKQRPKSMPRQGGSPTPAWAARYSAADKEFDAYSNTHGRSPPTFSSRPPLSPSKIRWDTAIAYTHRETSEVKGTAAMLKSCPGHVEQKENGVQELYRKAASRRGGNREERANSNSQKGKRVELAYVNIVTDHLILGCGPQWTADLLRTSWSVLFSGSILLVG